MLLQRTLQRRLRVPLRILSVRVFSKKTERSTTNYYCYYWLLPLATAFYLLHAIDSYRYYLLLVTSPYHYLPVPQTFSVLTNLHHCQRSHENRFYEDYQKRLPELSSLFHLKADQNEAFSASKDLHSSRQVLRNPETALI